VKKIRFVLHCCRQIGEHTYKDFYHTEIVEVSDRAYELLVGSAGANFMGAEAIQGEQDEKSDT